MLLYAVHIALVVQQPIVRPSSLSLRVVSALMAEVTCRLCPRKNTPPLFPQSEIVFCIFPWYLLDTTCLTLDCLLNQGPYIARIKTTI